MATLSNAFIIDIIIQPSTVITTQTECFVLVNTTAATPSRYKFSFGSWKFETTKARVRYSFSRQGRYRVQASAMVNATWSKWSSEEILVFDHDAVIASNCTVKLTFVLPSNTTRVPQGSTLGTRVVIGLNQCYGKGSLTQREAFDSFTAMHIADNYNEFVSYGSEEQQVIIFNTTRCKSTEIDLELITPTKTILLTEKVPAAAMPHCNATDAVNTNNEVQPSSPGHKLNGVKLNTVVVLFFVVLFSLYIMDAVIAYRGYKHLLKPVGIPGFVFMFLAACSSGRAPLVNLQSSVTPC